MDAAEKGEYALRSTGSFKSHHSSAPSPSYSGNGGEPSYEEITEIHQTLGRRMWDSTGLFVASGKALNAGGPASLLICFTLIGIMLYCTVHALGEMAVLFPVAGSFSAYSTRFLDPAWGFAMGWNYAMQWLVVLPLEIIAASITINFWDTRGKYDHAIFVTVFLVVIIGINLCGVKGYGEAEFFFALVKIVTVIGYILLGIIINCGGSPTGGYIGGKYWSDPGAFHNGFKGLCSVFVTAAFAFAGTELVGLAAAETANPRKSLPTAVKQVFWRISLFYILSLSVVGLLVPYNNPHLLEGGSANTAASPFVISIQNAGIDVLPSVMNAVILIAVLSVGNSSIFGSSRTLAALADQGQAPKILGYIDRKGRPIIAILVASVLGFIAYAADSSAEGDVLDWMLALSGLSSIFTWGSICLAHIRFRRAWKLQGHTLDELAFRSQPGVWKKTPFMRAKDMDLQTGIRELNLPALLAEERAEQAAWPTWKRAYKVVC
ncbi:General amino-acid permease [Lachnellula willkommii]|uniref:General amino-acid permease n=1 Tax=Lachnellula willkommii TaxID=215461 RepID=A0A559MH21_9HELO|nr:General amino-acid permease [Lachnellula willkommii]